MKSKKWKYVGLMEEMSDRELKKRIKEAMDFEIENKIRSIHCLGGEDLAIEYSYPELRARCLMMGLKDLYKIKIKFIPGKIMAEREI